VLQTGEGSQEYKPGDYIIAGVAGERYYMSASAFMNLKKDIGNQTAIPKKIPKLAKLSATSGKLKTKNGHTLEYHAGEDYIVINKSGDYGVVRADIFRQTYETLGKNVSKFRGEVARTPSPDVSPKPLQDLLPRQSSFTKPTGVKMCRRQIVGD